MINRNDPDTARRSIPSNELQDHRYQNVTSDRRSASRGLTDDIIVSLANSYENKRARQVSEWEQMRARAVQRSS